MKQSSLLCASREISYPAKLTIALLAFGFFFLCSLERSDAVEQEIKGSCQSGADFSTVSGTAHDGIAAAPRNSSSATSVEVSADLPYKYFGNNFSGKFHRPWCPYSQAMNAVHVVAFNFRWQAIESGYTPCNFCLPQQWKSVHCILLKQTKPQ